MISRLLSRLLRGVHAGDTHLAWNDPAVIAPPATILLSSPVFAAGGSMPARCAGKGLGENVSPPLAWSNLPDGTRELVLIVEDPDAPLPRPFVHLIAAGIDPAAGGVAEGALSGAAPAGLIRGRNSFRRLDYAGPRPLPGHGPHRYVFQLFALGAPLGVVEGVSKRELMRRLTGACLARGRLDGVFQRA